VNVRSDNNYCSSCLCGSPLQLDVLSLNRKLFREESKKLYCLACMADIFECTVEDVVNKFEAFKREGCRRFSSQVLRNEAHGQFMRPDDMILRVESFNASVARGLSA
jgi:hypothetical protein